MKRVRSFSWRVGSRLATQLIGVIRALCAHADREHLDRLAEHSPLGVRLEVHQVRPPQSSDQRGYFHAVLPDCADALGMEPDDLKREIKRKAWGMEEVATPFGKRLQIKSSGKADREQYSHLIETLKRTMVEMIDYQLPEPKHK